MHFEQSGAYTWEVSSLMLKELNCEYVILWHSERREYFHETNEIINKKVISALKNSIRPILCIWENLEQKEKWITKEILKIQIIEWLNNVEDFSKIDIAYEPIWAIWTWKIPTSEDIEEIHTFIRAVIGNDESRIIYWWSVKPENSKQIIKLNNVNWFLVWWASLQPSDFLKIAEI
jgi:triosephosphate isomerase